MSASRTAAQLSILSLSSSELAVLRRLAYGCSQASIASDLQISREEVAELKQSLMKKLGVTRTAEAVREAVYAGL